MRAREKKWFFTLGSVNFIFKKNTTMFNAINSAIEEQEQQNKIMQKQKPVYIATWEEEGEAPYQLRSDTCKSREDAGDSDWWFDKTGLFFQRYRIDKNDEQYMIIDRVLAQKIIIRS